MPGDPEFRETDAKFHVTEQLSRGQRILLIGGAAGFSLGAASIVYWASDPVYVAESLIPRRDRT